MAEALDAVLLESTEALDRLGLPNAIVGGLAVSDRLDQVYIEQWARMLDESVGTSEATTRIEHVRLQSNTGSARGR